MLRHSFITRLAAGALALTGCADAAVTPSGSVELVESITLSVPVGNVFLQGTAPARAASGHFAAQTLAGRGGGVAVFDPSGTFLTELNAQGRGPGEFSDLRSVGFGPGDTLWAVESTRAHAFAPAPDLRFIRTVNFEAPTNSTVTPRGFLARGIFTGEGSQPPALRDWDGRVIARFQLPDEIQGVEAQMGPVALDADGSLWVGHGARYDVVRLDAEGGPSRWIRRDVEWFPPDKRYEGALNVVRPPARLQQVATDPENRVLVLSRRAHPDWVPMSNGPAKVERKRTESAPAEAARARPSLADWGSLFEFVLEVFGPDGRLIASRTLDGGMQGFGDGTRVYQVLADADGRISLRLWDLRVDPTGVASR
jgi:hypothetical protein